MRKTCEKHAEKDPYIDSILGTLEIHLLIFKVHTLFLLVYILFLTFPINTWFSIFHPPLIKTLAAC